MNVVDIAHGLIGCFGIVGGSIAAATGAALSLKGTAAIAVAFFGDGAVNQAYFYECLNFAQVNHLPLLLVCENNLYGEFTPWEQVTAGQICDRPAALGIPTHRIDGNDLWAVRSASIEAVARVRLEQTPIFIEALTYRFGGHSRSDPARYRPPGELDAWRARDPLLVARQRLVDAYGISEVELNEVLSSVRDEVAATVTRGLEAPTPMLDASAALEFKP
jgi:TPP-dependent pyruvate/acetoin dehydrogenase alpha subunit